MKTAVDSTSAPCADRRLWTRRVLLAAAAGLAAASPLAAWSQAWPTRPVTIVVNGPPGGPVDILARMVGEGLAGALGQQVIIENKSGGAGSIGAQEVIKAAADGYTWLASYDGSFTESPHAMKVSYDPLKSLRPVVDIAFNGLVLAVSAEVPAKTLPEFIAWAKKQPGGLNYGSFGVGSSSQIRALQLAKATGLQLHHVPYRGNADAMQALLGGQLPMMFSGMVNVAQHHKVGKVRVLGFTGEQRSPFMPDVPTFKEQGLPTIVGQNWIGLWARDTMPAALRDRMHQEVSRVLSNPALRQRIEGLSTNPAKGRTPDDLARQMAADSAAVSALLLAEGITPQ